MYESDLSVSDLGSTAPVDVAEERRLIQVMVTGRKAAKSLRHPDLPDDERQRLTQAVEAGLTARRRLIEANGRLVISVAARYHRPGVTTMNELCQEGAIGLIRAIDKFEPAKAGKLSTYAVWWIRQAVQRSLTTHRLVRLPVHQFDRLTRLRRKELELAAEGRDFDEAEIAARTGDTVQNVRLLRQWNDDPLSLDAPVGDGGDNNNSLGDFTPGDESTGAEVEATMERAKLEQILDCFLTAREARVVRLRYGFTSSGETLTLERVAARFGLTRERVRQIEGAALKKLRRPEVQKLLGQRD